MTPRQGAGGEKLQAQAHVCRADPPQCGQKDLIVKNRSAVAEARA